MHLSGIELAYVVREINSLLGCASPSEEATEAYYVSNIYTIDDRTQAFKLHHSVKPERMLILSSGTGIWLTDYKLPTVEASHFTRQLRRYVERSRLKGVVQPGLERIATLHFGLQERVLKLIVELFGEGNIILTDEEDTILLLLHPLEVRDRRLRRGLKYTLPPPRGRDVEGLREEDFTPLCESKLEAARWLGRSLALPRKYVEEILAQAGLDPRRRGIEFSQEEVHRLYTQVVRVVQDVTLGRGEARIVFSNGDLLDATPFPFKTYSHLRSEPARSFLEALDRALTHQILERREAAKLESQRRRLRELEASIAEQERIRSEAEGRASALRRFAEGLLREASVHAATPLRELLPLLSDLVADVEERGETIRFKVDGHTLEAAGDTSPHSFASRVFDDAKGLERKVKAIEAARMRLLEEKERFHRSVEEAAVQLRQTGDVRRYEKMWFERYRWFTSSDGLMVVGGRDASSNSILIRRHLDKNDLVFHADLHGSPFFILKGYVPGAVRSVEEAAQAVVSFSRAWREGLSSADAYWVKPEQVKRAPPSGMYLPKGSFLIEGRKNYVRRVEVKTAVGLVFIKGLPTLMAGPPSAVKEGSVGYVVLVPESTKISDTAKRVKAALISTLTGDLAEQAKKLPLDTFIRALPPGGGRIVEKGRGGAKGLSVSLSAEGLEEG